MRTSPIVGVLTLCLLAHPIENEVGADAGEDRGANLAAALQDYDVDVLSAGDGRGAATYRDNVRRDVRARLNAANRTSSAAWRAVQSVEDWEAFRDERLQSLRRSLSLEPLPTEPQDVTIVRTHPGDGFVVECIVFTSRPGVFVTAHLYRPASASSNVRSDAMPGIVIVHSHHAPKAQAELQTMGMTWARLGATVLVMDQLGHGERRTHSFAAAGRYAGDYRPERQDYYFRYNTGLQLSLVGESLLGWMAADVMCGATLVAKQPGVDPKKLVLLGAVAGGGDPAGVTAALDERFAAVVPFNYGGYEPEDVFPLPDDADETFDYAGSGSWESTRNLRRSACDGFLPWVVIGSVAPRRVVYAHEFRWDEPRDPVWKRLGTIFDRYELRDRLASIVGRGTVKGRPPEASHCTNIGAVHRAQLYPLLERWFDLPIPESEYAEHRASAELRCRDDDRPFALHEVLQSLASERLAAARTRRHALDLTALRSTLREELAPLLGDVEPARYDVVHQHAAAPQQGVGSGDAGPTVMKSRLEIGDEENRLALPIVVLRGEQGFASTSPTVIVCVAQQGKAALLKQRADFVAASLALGNVVVLVDFVGTGETSPAGEGRGRTGGATSRSASEQMLGQTVVGRRVRELRTVLQFVRSRDDLRGLPIALYGDGLVPPNAAERPTAAPLDAADLPTACEPAAALICLLTALWENDVAAVACGGGLASYLSLLDGPYFYVPHDAVVPGLLAHADIDDLTAAQSARVRVFDRRDAANRAVAASDRSSRTPSPGSPSPVGLAEWFSKSAASKPR